MENGPIEKRTAPLKINIASENLPSQKGGFISQLPFSAAFDVSLGQDWISSHFVYWMVWEGLVDLLSI